VPQPAEARVAVHRHHPCRRRLDRLAGRGAQLERAAGRPAVQGQPGTPAGAAGRHPGRQPGRRRRIPRRPARPRRDGTLFRVLRLDALFGITVTLVTYTVLLAPQHDPHGISAWTNAGLHYVTPALAILGWLLFGPRPRIDERTLLLALIWPALYVGYTLWHGAASDWYPYPFVDAARLGYATVLRNGVGMVVLMAGVATGYRVGDHRLPQPS
jgi:hypothetical protein